MIKRFAIAFIMLALAGAAQAADLDAGSLKDGPVYAPIKNWTGFYAGASIGASFNRSDVTGEGSYAGYPGSFTSLEGYFPTSPKSSDTSAIVSVEAGYNWQIGSYVVGVAADMSWLNSKQKTGVSYLDGDTVYSNDPNSMSSKVDYLGLIRARLGYAVRDNVLLYGTGGLAVARYRGGFNDLPGDGDYPAGSVKSSDTSWGLGWVAGAGVDYLLTEHWIIRGEYLHVDTSTTLSTYNAYESEQYAQLSKLQQDIVRFGLYYKF
jgi:outer membrane immunogenic protein